MSDDLSYESADLRPSGRVRSLVALLSAIAAALLCVPSACIIVGETIAPPRYLGPAAPIAPPLLFLAAIAAFLISILPVLFAWWTLFPEERPIAAKAAMLLTLVTTGAVIVSVAAIPLERSLRRSESINAYLTDGASLAPSLLNDSGETRHDGTWSILCGQLDLAAASPAQRQSIITAVSSDIRNDRGRVMCFGDGTCRFISNADLDRVLELDDAARRSIGAPSHSYHLRTYMGVRSSYR